MFRVSFVFSTRKADADADADAGAAADADASPEASASARVPTRGERVFNALRSWFLCVCLVFSNVAFMCLLQSSDNCKLISSASQALFRPNWKR